MDCEKPLGDCEVSSMYRSRRSRICEGAVMKPTVSTHHNQHVRLEGGRGGAGGRDRVLFRGRGFWRMSRDGLPDRLYRDLKMRGLNLTGGFVLSWWLGE